MVAPRCAQHLPTKWLPTPSYCSKKSLRGLEEKAFFIAKGGARRKKHQNEMRENQPT